MKNYLARRRFINLIGISGLAALFPEKGLGNVLSGEEEKKLYPLLIDSEGNPITTLDGWLKHRGSIKKRWLGYMGALPTNPKPPILKVINEEKTEGFIRQLVEYEGEPGITVKGYLLIPENVEKSVPGIVAMHSTSDGEMLYLSGIKQGQYTSFGYNLAKKGFVVFCPQCFLKWYVNKSESAIEEVNKFHERHPDSKGMAKMLFDAQRAVDALESLDYVDSERIGAVGHSLGGKEVFYLGAFDDRVKAIVSSEGGIGIDFSNWDAVWYLDKEIKEFPYKHHEVLALVAPKNFLLMGGDGYDGEISRPYIDAVKPVYDLYGSEKGILELLSHSKGHSVPKEAEEYSYQWMTKYL